MTHEPDDRQPDEHSTEPSEPQESPSPLDEDAAWAQIVANYGDRPEMGRSPEEARAAEARRPANPFDRSYLDSLNTEATWDDEGHFVPPTPPPLPPIEPRRKAAWIGLFGAPTLMLLGVVMGWRYPDLVSAILVAAFVGGFVYLVATMRRTPRDPWSGDDGAVV